MESLTCVYCDTPLSLCNLMGCHSPTAARVKTQLFFRLTQLVYSKWHLVSLKSTMFVTHVDTPFTFVSPRFEHKTCRKIEELHQNIVMSTRQTGLPRLANVTGNSPLPNPRKRIKELGKRPGQEQTTCPHASCVF